MIGRTEKVSQRSMARELGVALGLVNLYLKRCISKGYVKVTQVPANRYAYYLTPQGFSMKARLTGEFLSQSFQFFRHARNECSALLQECEQNGWRRIALAGVSDLTELVTLSVLEHQLEVTAILGTEGGSYRHIPVVASARQLAGADAVMVTDLISPDTVYQQLTECFPDERILTPRLLRIVRRPLPVAEVAT